MHTGKFGFYSSLVGSCYLTEHMAVEIRGVHNIHPPLHSKMLSIGFAVSVLLLSTPLLGRLLSTLLFLAVLFPVTLHL